MGMEMFLRIVRIVKNCFLVFIIKRRFYIFSISSREEKVLFV